VADQEEDKGGPDKDALASAESDHTYDYSRQQND